MVVTGGSFGCFVPQKVGGLDKFMNLQRGLVSFRYWICEL